MRSLIIDPQIRSRPRGAEPVDRHPRQDLVVRPGVIVRPKVEFLVDPGEQADGAVAETVAEGLGLGGLLETVARAFLGEPGGAREARLLAGSVRGEGVAEGEKRGGSPGWAAGAYHAEVGGADGGRVEEAHDAGYYAAPVAALGHCSGSQLADFR